MNPFTGCAPALRAAAPGSRARAAINVAKIIVLRSLLVAIVQLVAFCIGVLLVALLVIESRNLSVQLLQYVSR